MSIGDDAPSLDAVFARMRAISVRVAALRESSERLKHDLLDIARDCEALYAQVAGACTLHPPLGDAAAELATLVVSLQALTASLQGRLQ